MKQIYLKCFLIGILSLMGITTFAYDCKVDGIYYNLNTYSNTATVTYYISTSENYSVYTGDLSIPSTITYRGTLYKVTGIGWGAFNYCGGLKSLTIPNSVTSIESGAFNMCGGLETLVVASDNKNYDSRNNCNAIIETATNTLIRGCKNTIIPNNVARIGKYAFSSCTSLTSITIPNSVTNIGIYAFYRCYDLTSITIPNSVTTIGDNTFEDCTNLTSITIPNNVTSIGNNAFKYCRNLTSITIPNSVTTIGSYAFYDCRGLKSFTIPNSVTTIENATFSNCYGLTSITIPNSVTSIGDNTFLNCINLTSITIPNSVTSIGNNAFKYCTNLTSITIPNSVTTIGDNTFANCSGLMTVKLSNTLSSIGSQAFQNCTNLTSIIIPNSVSSIGSKAFEGCNCSVICNCKIPPTAYDDTFVESMIAIVPNDLVSKYKQATGWNKMAINPLCFLGKTTQSSITLCSYNLMSNVKAILNGVSYYSKNDSIKITGLDPNTTYTISLSGDFGDIHLENQMNVTTKNINLSIQLVKRTNLTLRLKGYVSDLGDAVIAGSGFDGYEGQNELYIDGLKPGYSYYYTYFVVTASGKKISSTNSFQTLPITLNVSATTEPSSALLSGSSNIIDATVIDFGFDSYPKQNPIKITGLDPNKSYSQTFYLVTKEGGRISKSITYTTKSLTLTTSQPKVISAGNVIVAAESNLDDEETNVGFEWRRTDWTSEFTSNTGMAYLYNGTMEGYIRSLNTEKLWKFRPFYTSNTGNTYYGEWVGIDPTNTSYFEPTVHTYANVTVNGNSVEVKGYVQKGTDNVLSKGFAYWKQSRDMNAKEANTVAPSKISSVPSYAKTVEVSGSQQVMTASISDLEYETTYRYVAFVRTSEGDTFYGEEMTFTSGESPYIPGDVNGDKKVDISDVVLLVNHILGTSSTSLNSKSADMNNDNKIDISDVVAIVNMILGQ